MPLTWSFAMLREYPLDEGIKVVIEHPVRGRETFRVTSIDAVREPNLMSGLQIQTNLAMAQVIQQLTSHGATGMSEIVDQVEAWCRTQRRGMGQTPARTPFFEVVLAQVEELVVDREMVPSRFKREPLV